ncbi:hypothetical protein OH491_05775 [Termitidicoccus mucosus]|uniref:Uncharacterized protein n=1 Tax=Termitidicoccus mucosus TaxID=1184151 RepID=A0A178IE95_9BACT|nr:hypothetical protein AW736_19205 [Opitutaceae bacterium TSB47]
MDKNHPNKNSLTENKSATASIPTPRERVHMRTRELAMIAGLKPSHVSQTDYEQAKREVTGESDADRQEAMLDSINEIKPWNPVPGSIGSQTPESSLEDEDAEGRSENEQLAEKGVEAAGEDRIRQAARATAQEDRREQQVRSAVKPCLASGS